MKLARFSVANYRSITDAPHIPVRPNLTILLGPNNEGKSNLLRALTTALAVLESLPEIGQAMERRRSSPARAKSFDLPARFFRDYDWKEDFPIQLQEKEPEGESVFGLEFDLSPDEVDAFRESVGSDLNGSLPVKLEISPEKLTFRVTKRGPGARVLSGKAPLIAYFISERLDFQNIPAVRTARRAREVVADIVASELSVLEGEEAYRQALERVSALQQPILDNISKNITKTLREFLPAIRSVTVSSSEERQYRALRQAEMLVDDGTLTPLESKGDGIISLAAISLIRHASRTGNVRRGRRRRRARPGKGKRNLILAIEEPESHLHPQGMHQLKRVIREIAEEHQVLLTTHNQVFVERSDIRANILVEKQKARPAANIAEIRDSLGVRIGDNLRNSEVVIIVEGGDDRIALKALLSHYSVKLKGMLDDNRLGIASLAGGTNLSYMVSSLQPALCLYCCLLDYDKTGRMAFQRAKEDGLLSEKDVVFTRCKKMGDAEIEDWYDQAVYRDFMKEEYGDVLDNDHFKKHKAKWSDRLKNAFEKQGLHWDDAVEASVKLKVARLVAASPGRAIRAKCRSVLESLVAKLEQMLPVVGKAGNS